MNNAIKTSITIPLYYSENDDNLTIEIDREEMLREFNHRIDLIETQLKLKENQQ